MSSGLYSGASGLALGVGLYADNPGLWSGAPGLITGAGASLYLNFLAGAPLDSRVTFTRTTTATVTGSNGVIQSSAINEPRFDYDPVTLAPKGLLIEEQRVNLLLNSLIDGTSLSTQSVTVAAVAHTISFYGTGTITLTGAAVATVTGTGVYPSRKTLTFTPIVGVLVCTVSGSVQYAQIEAGAFATSFIPTAGATATRSADVAAMTSTNFSSWYNQIEGAFVGSFDVFLPTSTMLWVGVSDGTSSNRMQSGSSSGSSLFVNVGGVNQVALSSSAVTANAITNRAITYKTNDFAVCTAGGSVATDTLGTLPTVDRLAVGGLNSGSQLNGHIRSITYYNTRLPDATLQALTA